MNVPRRSCFASSTEVRAAMLKKLVDSALTQQDAAKLCYKPVMGNELDAKAQLPAYRAGFIIPYFNLQGKQSTFYRVRYLEYGDEFGFAALTNGSNGKRRLRYGQPTGTLNELYIPPNFKWADYAKDPSKPIVITEGELKAACATKHGIPTLGLGGVWCFKSARNGLPLLESFRWFDWAERIVYICYDSDAASNTDVMTAENALARELLGLGAHPYIVRMPALNDKKTGIDDFIVAKGDEAFMKLLKQSEEWQASEELFRLNEEVVYVNDPGIVMRLDTFQAINPASFFQHAYADRKYHRRTVDAKGNIKLEERCAPKDWLSWPSRAKVKKITYKPGAPRATDEGEINTWRGWGCQPKKGDVARWKSLMKLLFKEDTAAAHWFQQWLAYPLQHPGTKLYSACLLWGRIHGTGKSLIGYTMFHIYGDNATEIGDRDLHAVHNEWVKDKQFIMADEVIGGETKRATADRMKSMITQTKLRINPKYVSSYTIPDCVNYYFTSNHADAFFVEDSDRRFMVHEVLAMPQAREYYQDYVDWLNNGGAEALFFYLLNYDLIGFSPAGHALETSAKHDMIDIGRSDIGDWVSRLRETPDSVLNMSKHRLWSTATLHVLYDPMQTGRVSLNGISRELRRAGFRKVYGGQPVPGLSDGAQRLWAIRDADDLLAIDNATKLADIYNKERGQTAKPKKEKWAK